jgi:hypothetical protein
MNMQRNGRWSLLAAAVFVMAATAGERPQAAAAPVQGDEVRIAIDPVTGKPREPTLQELRELQAQDEVRQAMAVRSRPRNAADAMRGELRLRNGGTSILTPESQLSDLQAVDCEGLLRIGHLQIGHGDSASTQASDTEVCP